MRLARPERNRVRTPLNILESTVYDPIADKLKASDLQVAQIGNAGFHHFQLHFDEVIPDAAGFCGGEDLLPIQAVLAYRRDFFRLRGPALHVHGDESAWVLGEIFGRVVAAADGGNLELELHQLGVE